MTLLLDTHVLLWWLADDPHLTPTMREAIADPSTTVMVSAASAWEAAIKAAVGKLTVPDGLRQEVSGTASTSYRSPSRTAWQPALCRVTTATRSTAC